MFPTLAWRPFAGVGKERLVEARLQAHYAVQWLARLARAAVPAQPDDSHTSLGWDGEFDGFLTHPLRDGAQLGLRLRDLTLSAVGGEPQQRPYSLLDRRDDEARAWMKLAFGPTGLSAEALDAPSPYAMAPHAIGQAGRYGGAHVAEGLRELAAWFANGQAAIEKLRRALLDHGHDAPPPRCWPHHFDLATSTSFPRRRDGVQAYIGAGLSPGDRYYEEPYFYLSVYPAPDRAALPPLPPFGHWHVEDFTGAVATAAAIRASARPEADTDAFLAAALEAALALCR